MANTVKSLARSALGTGSATYYTTPGATSAVITNILLANNAAVARTASVWLNDVLLIPAASIPANSVATYDIRQVLPTGQTLKALASAATDVTLHASGVEIA